jgi:hypothetical protein
MVKLLFVIFLFFGSLYAEFRKSAGIVTDTTYKVMWQDNFEIIQDDNPLAQTYCDSLVLNGYTDWQLPTIMQLQTLIDTANEKVVLEKAFEYFEKGKYWSSTDFAQDLNKYWYLNISNGEINFEDASESNFIRCVRDLK